MIFSKIKSILFEEKDRIENKDVHIRLAVIPIKDKMRRSHQSLLTYGTKT